MSEEVPSPSSIVDHALPPPPPAAAPETPGYTFFVPSKRRKFFGPRVLKALSTLNAVNPPPVLEDPASASDNQSDPQTEEDAPTATTDRGSSTLVASPYAVPNVPHELGPTLEFHKHVSSRHAGGEVPLESLRRLTDVEALAIKARWHERHELGSKLVAAVDTTTMTAEEKQRQALIEKRMWVGLQCDRRDDSKSNGRRKAKWFEDKPAYSPAVLMLSQISSKAVASLQKKQNVKAGAHLLQLDPPLVEPYHPLALVSRNYFDIPSFELSVVDVILSYEAICLMNPSIVSLFDAAERLGDGRCLADSVHALQSARAASPDGLRTGRCAVLSVGDVAVAYNIFPELPSFEFPRFDPPLPLRPHHGPFKRCRVTTWVDHWEHYLRLEEKRLQSPKSATRMYQLFSTLHINGSDCKLWIVKRILRWELKAKRSLFRFTKLRARLLLSSRRAFEATSLRVNAPDGVEEGVDPVTLGSSSEEEGGNDFTAPGVLLGPPAGEKDVDLFAPPMALGDCGGVMLTRSNAGVKLKVEAEAAASSHALLSMDSSASILPVQSPMLAPRKSLLVPPEEQRIAVHARMASEAIVNVIILPPDNSASGVTVDDDETNRGSTIASRSSAAPDSLAVELAGRLVDIILELEIDLREKRMLAIKFGADGQGDVGKSQHSPRMRKDEMRGFGEGAALGMIKSQASVDAAERANPVGSAVNTALKKFQTFFLHSILTMRAKGSVPQRGFISLRQVFSDVFRATSVIAEFGTVDGHRQSTSRSSRLSSVGSSVAKAMPNKQSGATAEKKKSTTKPSAKKSSSEPPPSGPQSTNEGDPLQTESKPPEVDPESQLRELLLPILTKTRTKRRGRLVEHQWLNEYDDASLDVLRRRERSLTNADLVEEITTLFARLVETIESVDSVDDDTGKRSMAGDKKREAKRNAAQQGANRAEESNPSVTRRVPRKQFGTVLKVLVDRMVRRLLLAVVTLLSGILTDCEKVKHDCEDILALTSLPTADEAEDGNGLPKAGAHARARPYCFNLFTDRLSSMCYPQSYVEFLRGWQWLCDEPLTIPTIWSCGRSGSASTAAPPPLAGHQLPLLFDVRGLDKSLRYGEFVEKGQRSASPISVAEAIDIQPEDLDLLCQIFAPRDAASDGGQARTPRGNSQQQRGAVAEEQFVVTILHILDMGHITLVADTPPPTVAQQAPSAAASEVEERRKSTATSLQRGSSTVTSKKQRKLMTQPLQSKRGHAYSARDAVLLKWDIFITVEAASLLQDVSHVTIALFEKQLVKDLLADVLLELRLEMVRSWQVVQDRRLLEERKDLHHRQSAEKGTGQGTNKGSVVLLAEDKMQNGIVRLLEMMPPSEKECFRLVQSVWRTEFDRRAPDEAREWEAEDDENGLAYLHRKISDCLKIKPSRFALSTRCDQCHKVPSGLIYQHKLQPVSRSAALTQDELDSLLSGDATRDLQTTANFSYSHVEFFEGERNRRQHEVAMLRRKGLTRSITDYVDLVLCFDCIPKYLARVLLKRLIEVLDTSSVPSPAVDAADPPSPAALGRRRRSDLTKAQMHGADPSAAAMTQDDWHQVNMIIRRKIELARQKSQRRLSQVEDEEDDRRDDSHVDLGEGGLTESGTFRRKKKKKKAPREEDEDEMLELKTLDVSTRVRGRKNLLEERLSAQLKVVYLQQLYEAQKAERKQIRVEERQIRIEMVTEFAKKRYNVNFGHLEEEDNDEPSADMMEGLAAAIAEALAAMGGGGKNSLLDGLDDDIGDEDDAAGGHQRKPAQSKFASKSKAARDSKGLLSKSGKTVEQLEEFVRSETARIQSRRAQDDVTAKMRELEEARRELQELVAEKQRRAEKAKLEKQKQKQAELTAARSTAAANENSLSLADKRDSDDEQGEEALKDIAKEGGRFTRKKRNKVATFVEDDVAPDEDPEPQPTKVAQPSLPGQIAKAMESVKAAAEKAHPSHERQQRKQSFPQSRIHQRLPKEVEHKDDNDDSTSSGGSFDDDVASDWLRPDPDELAAIRSTAAAKDTITDAESFQDEPGAKLFDALIKKSDESEDFIAFSERKAAEHSTELGEELTEAYQSFVAASRRSSLLKLTGSTHESSVSITSSTSAAAEGSVAPCDSVDPEALRAAEEVQKKLNSSPLVQEWFTSFEADVLGAAGESDSIAALENKASSSEMQRNTEIRTRMVYALLRELFATSSRLLGEDTLCRHHDKAIVASLRLFDCLGADNIFLRAPELYARSNRLELAEGALAALTPNELRGVGMQLWRDPARKFGPMKWTLLNAPWKAQKAVQAYVRQCWTAALSLAQKAESPHLVPTFALAPVSPAPINVKRLAKKGSSAATPLGTSPKIGLPRQQRSSSTASSPATSSPSRRVSEPSGGNLLGVAMQASTGGMDLVVSPSVASEMGPHPCEDEPLEQVAEIQSLPQTVATEVATTTEGSNTRKRSSVHRTSVARRLSLVPEPDRALQQVTGALIPVPAGTAPAAAQATFQSRLAAMALLLLFQERSYVALVETWAYSTHTLYLDLYGAAKVQRVSAHDFAKFSLFTLHTLRLEIQEGREDAFDGLDAQLVKEWKLSKSVMLSSQRHQVVRKYESLAFSHIFLCYCGIEEYAQSLMPTVASQIAAKCKKPSLAAELKITPFDCLRLAEIGTERKLSRLVLTLHECQTAKISESSTHQERLYDAARRVQFLQELGRLSLCLWVLGPLREARSALFASGFSPHAVCWNAQISSHPSKLVGSAAALLRFAEAHLCGADPYGTPDQVEAEVRKQMEDHLVRSIILSAPRRRSQVPEHSTRPLDELSEVEEKREKESVGTSVYAFYFRSWTKSQLVSLGLQLLLSALAVADSEPSDGTDATKVRKGFRFDPMHFQDSSDQHLASFGEAITSLTSQGHVSDSLMPVLPTLNVGLQYCFAENEVGTSTVNSPTRRNTVAELRMQQIAQNPDRMPTQSTKARAVVVLPFPVGDGAGGSHAMLPHICSETLSTNDAQKADKARTEHRRYLDDIGIVLVATRKWFAERVDAQQRRKGAGRKLPLLQEGSLSANEGEFSSTVVPFIGASTHQFDFSVVGDFAPVKSVKIAGEAFQQNLLARRASKALSSIIGEYHKDNFNATMQSVNTVNAVASLMISPEQLPRFDLPSRSSAGGDEFAWSIPALPRMMSVLQVNERFGAIVNAVSREVGQQSSSEHLRAGPRRDMTSAIVSETAHDLKKSVLFLPAFPTMFDSDGAQASVREGEGTAIPGGLVVKECGPLQEKEAEEVRRRVQLRQETMNSFELALYMDRLQQRSHRPPPDDNEERTLDAEGFMVAPSTSFAKKLERRSYEFFVPVLAVAYRLMAGQVPQGQAPLQGFIESDCIVLVQSNGGEHDMEGEENDDDLTCYFLHDVKNAFVNLSDEHLAEVISSAPPLTSQTEDSAANSWSVSPVLREEAVADVLKERKRQVLQSLPWVECRVRRSTSGSAFILESPVGNYRMTSKHLQLLTTAAQRPRLVFPAAATSEVPEVLSSGAEKDASRDVVPRAPVVLSQQQQDYVIDSAIADATSEDVATLCFALQYLCEFPASTAEGARVSHSAEAAARDRLIADANAETSTPHANLSRAMRATLRKGLPVSQSNRLATPRNGFEPRGDKSHANIVISCEPSHSQIRLPALSATPQPTISGRPHSKAERDSTQSCRRPRKKEEALPALRPRASQKATVE